MTSSGVVPYGTIPKYTDKKRKTRMPSLQLEQKCTKTPYPFFQPPSISPLSSFLSKWFNRSNKKTTSRPLSSQYTPLIGFMPQSAPPTTTLANPSENDISSTINLNKESETISIPFQKQQQHYCTGYYTSTSTLSEILCDHYVQQQMMADEDCPSLSPTSTTSSSETSMYSDDDFVVVEPPTTHVPLATFRMFQEQLNDTEVQQDNNKNSNNNTLLENSWANWQETCLTKQWTLTGSVQLDFLQVIKLREPRINSAHLRMLVAEVNMMRADKIVGPLRPRNYLPKRSDSLSWSPSPLSITTFSS
ncbi:hypothetical protein BC941DRAFT_475768 [Chlamydoabsidia padenii]|nr:hypothetical protein BC941DRAFT_475768 [Chlamydoabsidia padenii]